MEQAIQGKDLSISALPNNQTSEGVVELWE